MTAVPTERYRRSPRALWRRGPTRALLLIDGTIHELPPPGRELWEALGERRTLAELTTVATNRFSGPGEEIEHDVGALVTALVDLGAIERVTS